jgi:hypothetical protein
MLSTILAEAKISQGFPIIQGSALQICDSIPGQDGTVCYIVSGQNSTSGPKTAGGQDQVSSVVGLSYCPLLLALIYHIGRKTGSHGGNAI